jgi:hypothetical protein
MPNIFEMIGLVLCAISLWTMIVSLSYAVCSTYPWKVMSAKNYEFGVRVSLIYEAGLVNKENLAKEVCDMKWIADDYFNSYYKCGMMEQVKIAHKFKDRDFEKEITEYYKDIEAKINDKSSTVN